MASLWSTSRICRTISGWIVTFDIKRTNLTVLLLDIIFTISLLLIMKALLTHVFHRNRFHSHNIIIIFAHFRPKFRRDWTARLLVLIFVHSFENFWTINCSFFTRRRFVKFMCLFHFLFSWRTFILRFFQDQAWRLSFFGMLLAFKARSLRLWLWTLWIIL